MQVLIRGVSRALERPDCEDAADPDVDLGEVVVDDWPLFHRLASFQPQAIVSH
jgi:hypothetical protein